MLKTLFSNANRWVPCPGSVLAESNFPRQPQHADAAEGDAAHWIVSEVLKSWHPQARPVALDGYQGAIAPNGRIITAEMIDFGQLYLDTVWERAYQHPTGIDAEVWVEAPNYVPNTRGKIDCRWLSLDGTRLKVWDYKYGIKPVPAFQNYQLLCYALSSVDVRTQEIEMLIVQPRQRGGPGPVRRWTITVETLLSYGIYINGRATLVNSENPPTYAGPWCRYCQFAGDCDTLDAAGADVMDAIGTTVGTELTDNQVAYQLEQYDRAKELLRARGDALEAIAAARMQNGRSIPGFAYKSTLGNRRWTRGPGAVYAFGTLLGVELRESQPCSPAEAERRGISKDVVNTLVERREGPAKVVRVDSNIAREVFNSG